MPTYNEEACISIVVESWINIINEYPDSEFLVINDGSTDRTKEKLDYLSNKYPKLKVIHKPNGGHGHATLCGYEEAIKTDHTWVFQTDSDGQFTPLDFHKLWEKRHCSNFILGWRLQRNDPFHRIAITKIVRLFNLIFFGIWIKDANVPYRLINKDYLKQLLEFFPNNVFAPNIILSILAKKDGQNLINIPLEHKERSTGTISIMKLNLIKCCLRGMKELSLLRMSFPMIKIKKEDTK